ncbi:hypothetical protein SAMN04488030_1010 [Aliiroseovarius halocynthiae]|uniref:Uncharacterized protein n=1 Tax=Aliiroseovarius halocynthiae TaxID=985055 RepID=A0A545SVE7_9RHOB|nr:hypothetical protein [Aliiroseovarius halocynthiae]TQV68940.1 hypothetical protein FIL88_05025 [Aliiroseovarius halocynthiae]SMR71622.1 hypothetical protein SAMN04488030_1010 [Aliiroseovarius halocynthiae]
MMSNLGKPTLRKKLSYRMALPTWRVFGVQRHKRVEDETISREEIEGIFEDELRRKRRSKGPKSQAPQKSRNTAVPLILKN